MQFIIKRFKNAKIANIIKGLAITSIILIIFNIVALQGLNLSIKRERASRDLQYKLDHLGHEILEVSDYLTNQARNFTQFGETVYYDNYFNEINNRKRTEAILDEFIELGISQEHLDMIQDAISLSNNLSITEQLAMEAVLDNNFEYGRRLLFNTEYNEAKEKIDAYTNNFINSIDAATKLNNIRAINVSKAILVVVCFCLAFLVATILLALVLLSFKTKNLKLVADKLHNLSQNDGDLTAHVDYDSQDEVGVVASSFNSFVSKVRSIVQDVYSVSLDVVSATEELSATTNQVSISTAEVAKAINEITQATNDQAQHTEQGASSIHSLGEFIEEDIRLVNKLEGLSNDIFELVEGGYESIKSLEDSSLESSNIANELTNITLETNDSVKRIASASQMIQAIADQTNLLALNATIEAARAGESGRGFAVVANEIKNLADESNNFANQIVEIINDLILKIESMNDSIAMVDNITDTQNSNVIDTKNRFENITHALNNIKSEIQTLYNGQDNMSIQKDNVVEIMESLSAISEENAAGAEEVFASIEEQTASTKEIAATADNLSSQSNNILKAINQFKY